MKKLNLIAFSAITLFFAIMFYFAKTQNKNIVEDAETNIYRKNLTSDPTTNSFQKNEKNTDIENYKQKSKVNAFVKSKKNNDFQKINKENVSEAKEAIKENSKNPEISSQSPYLLELVLETEEGKYMKREIDGETLPFYLFKKICFESEQQKKIEQNYQDFLLSQEVIKSDFRGQDEMYVQFKKNEKKYENFFLSILSEEQKIEYAILLEEHQKRFEHYKKTDEYKKSLEMILEIEERQKQGQSMVGISFKKEE